MMMQLPKTALDLSNSAHIIDEQEDVSLAGHPQLISSPLNEMTFLDPTSTWAAKLNPFFLSHRRTDAQEWYVQCAFYGMQSLGSCVEVDRNIRSGVPVLRGTRVTVSEALAELAESCGIDEVSENFDLDAEQLRDVVNGLSLLLNQPYPR
jgi:uncharacterized protein (DUF433 family)